MNTHRNHRAPGPQNFPAAARLGELARERWRRAHGWKLKPPGEVDSSPWPASVANWLEVVPVAIARTEPAHAGRTAVDEIRRLYLDAIAGTRPFICIENQYFTAGCLADALSERLEEADGPEVILVLPQRTGGWLEQVTMDVLRGAAGSDRDFCGLQPDGRRLAPGGSGRSSSGACWGWPRVWARSRSSRATSGRRSASRAGKTWQSQRRRGSV